MASVEKKAKRAAERCLKNPVAYSWNVDVDTTAPDEQTLLKLTKKLDITAKASKHVGDVLYLRIGEFRQRLGFLLGVYRARIHVDGLRATPREQRAYVKRLEKHLIKTGMMPEEPQYWPPSVRYNREVIEGAPPLDAVKQYNEVVHETKETSGQPATIDKDRLILGTLSLITSYGVCTAEARQYTELVLKASGVKVPNIGDSDGRALRFVMDRVLRFVKDRARERRRQ